MEVKGFTLAKGQTKVKCGFTLAEGTSYCTLLSTKVKFAFTLAEVLITLGIIGVVAAMTIPTLSAKITESRTVNQLKAVHSILAQAMRSIQEEVGVPEDWDFVGKEPSEAATIIAEKLKPALKIALDCGLDDSAGLCFPSVEYKKLNNSLNGNFAADNEFYKLVLMNGSALMLRPSGTGIIVYADTNGKNSPNTFGRDMFQFWIGKKGNVLPIGDPIHYPGEAQHNCSLDGTGYGCTYYVLHNGNMNYLHKK